MKNIIGLLNAVFTLFILVFLFVVYFFKSNDEKA